MVEPSEVFSRRPELVGATEAPIDKGATIGRGKYRINCNGKRQNITIDALLIYELLELSQKLRECGQEQVRPVTSIAVDSGTKKRRTAGESEKKAVSKNNNPRRIFFLFFLGC